MKKTAIILAAAAVFGGASAYAANGDVIEPIYSTDIMTYIDGVPIQGYNIDGETMIVLEDLADYGYTVAYDDSVRALLVNKTHEPPADSAPQIERGTVGEVVGYTYETDIKAYFNSNYIQVVNIGGKLAAKVEGTLCEPTVYESYGTEQTACSMEYYYDDSARTLNVTTHLAEARSYDEQMQGLSDYIERIGGFEITSIEKDIYDGCDAVMITEYDGDMEISKLRLFYHDGHVIDMDDILDKVYGFGSFPYLTVFDGRLSEDRSQYLFYGERYRATGMRESEFIESGNYSMDLKSGIVTKVSE